MSLTVTDVVKVAFDALEVYNITTWPWWFYVLYSAVLCAGVELLSYIVIHWFSFADRIAVKGKHQDVLETIDLAFIYWNRLTMLPFMYHAIQLVAYSPNSILRSYDDATWQNTLGSLVLYYFVYDFFYHVSEIQFEIPIRITSMFLLYSHFSVSLVLAIS